MVLLMIKKMKDINNSTRTDNYLYNNQTQENRPSHPTSPPVIQNKVTTTEPNTIIHTTSKPLLLEFCLVVGSINFLKKSTRAGFSLKVKKKYSNCLGRG